MTEGHHFWGGGGRKCERVSTFGAAEAESASVSSFLGRQKPKVREGRHLWGKGGRKCQRVFTFGAAEAESARGSSLLGRRRPNVRESRHFWEMVGGGGRRDGFEIASK